MDFQRVVSTLLRDFEHEGIHYAIIGGFAMGLWGATRATVNMDSMEKVRVLIPEDIIGLKVQALSNDSSRELKDYADIDALLQARRSNSKEIAWPLLHDYFKLFDKLNLYSRLAKKYDAPDETG